MAHKQHQFLRKISVKAETFLNNPNPNVSVKITLLVAFLVIIVAIVQTSMNSESSFLHWGPGTKESNTPSLFGMKIDNGAKYAAMMLFLILFALSKRWKKNTTDNYVDEIKKSYVDINKLCAKVFKYDGSKRSLNDFQDFTDCKRKLKLSFLIPYILQNPLYELIPAMVFAETKQLQYIMPQIVVQWFMSYQNYNSKINKKWSRSANLPPSPGLPPPSATK